MRIFALLFLIIFLNLFSNAQNYQPVNSAGESYFSFSCNYNQQCVNAIRIDSIVVNSGDSIFFNYRVIQDEELSETQCFNKRDTNWTGDKIVINNAEAVFFNATNDSIKILFSGALSGSWKMYAYADGTYLQAGIVSITEQNVLGISDSVKTIRIQAKDSAGNNISNIFNLKEILLSKNFGMIKTFNFLRFPTDTTIYTLAGSTDPAIGLKNIGAKEIFDFSIGDEFHYVKVLSSVPYYGTSRETKRIVIGKSISSGQDTIFYTYSDNVFELFLNWQDNTTDSLVYDTIINRFIDLDENPEFETLPYEVFPQWGYSILYPGIRVSKNMKYFILIVDTCEKYIHTDPGGLGNFYTEGLGGPYWDNSNSPSLDYNELVYYKKGNETWGSPLGLSAMHSKEAAFRIFPLPFSDDIFIELNNNKHEPVEVSLYNALGEKILADNYPAARQIHVNLGSNYPAGFYFIRIKSGDIFYSIFRVDTSQFYCAFVFLCVSLIDTSQLCCGVIHSAPVLRK